MSKYTTAVINAKPEFSYLNTSKTLKETYSDGNINSYNPKIFPYAKTFMFTVLKRVNDTYAALVEEDNRRMLCEELYNQLKNDFRFDFSDHLGPMRQRDKRGAGTDVIDNDYNMFHSCYKFVNQAARAYSFGEKFNLSLMSGRINTDNQTGPEICDPFNYGPPLYLYSKNFTKIIAMTLPGFDDQNKISQLKAHEKEMKKDMFDKKSQATKAVKGMWHGLINKEFVPEGMEFKDLTIDTVKKISELHKEVLSEVSSQVENQFEQDVKMLDKVIKLLNKQMTYNKVHNKPVDDLACFQLASIHAMQANELLKDSSVIQVSIEAEKPIYKMMADILDDEKSLTHKIFTNPATRKVFEDEMTKIHTTKSDIKYSHLLDKMDESGSKMPEFSKVLGEEYQEVMTAEQMADKMRKGEAMPKVSFMLAVVLMETGAKIEGGSSQIVYAKKIRKALDKVFAEAENYSEFDKDDIERRRQVINKFDYRTAQAQIWGVKENGDVLGYRDLVNRNVTINDNMLSNVASVSSANAFEAASVHRFYSFLTGNQMSMDEFSEQKDRVKDKVMTFKDNADTSKILLADSKYYKRLAQIIKSDENVQAARAKKAVFMFRQRQVAWSV